ncbi:sugar porter family MFS transporter [Sporobolomyces salmoneus]|uniref:sugar porter family MFS transporter n=1 Tax=Sporobolomyces salmoneus TaxID=183962 RepID=UPI00317281BD
MSPPRRSFITRFTTNNYVAGALVTLGGCCFGADISSMSGQLSNPYYLSQFNHPDSALQGGITASMPAGSFAGALINSYLADKIGRKKTIIIGAWIWVLGCIVQSVANNVVTLVAGRVVAGLSVGILSAIVTTYQAELTKPSIRGRIVSIQQLSIMSGIFLQYFVQLGASYINSDASFRLPWALQLIPGLILGSLMWLFPESPRWLCDHGRDDEALQILADVHAQGDTEDNFVKLEFFEIQRAIEFEKTQAAKSYLDLFHASVRRRVFLGMAEQMWSQLSGMNVMMYYVIYVFQSAGITGREGELIASSVQYALGVAFTIPAVIYIDRWGRRPMLLYGALAMGMWLFLVGGLQGGFGHAVENPASDATTTWVVEGNKGATYAIIVCSYLFVSSFAISWGPCSWTYASEIFPTRVRAKAVSLSTASNSFNFSLAFATPPAFRNIQWKTYFVFGSFCFAAAIHITFMYPETRGRTLEEMEEVFDGNKFTAWRVKSDAGKKTHADAEAAIEQISREEKDDLKLEVSHVEHA